MSYSAFGGLASHVTPLAFFRAVRNNIRRCEPKGDPVPDKALGFGSDLKLILESPARDGLPSKQAVASSNPVSHSTQLSGKEVAMGNNLRKWIKEYWKYIVCCLSPLVIIAIIFSLPLKTVAVQVEESYFETEIKKQPYTVTESYLDKEAVVTEETRSETIYDSTVSGYDGSYSFKVKKPETTVNISWKGYYPYRPYIIYWCKTEDCKPGLYWYPFPDYYWDGARMVIKITYPESITTYKEVTKSRDVTRYVDVPTPILKTRTVTKYQKVSVWNYLFR